MKKIFIICVGIAFTLLSCNGSSPKQTTVQSNGEVITQVSENDADMNVAIKKANETFGDFKKVFIDNQKSHKYEDFTIKLGFPSNKYGKEHMWVGDLTLDGDTFTGILLNTPADESITHKAGDAVIVDPAIVSDWVYTEISNGITHGGYTFHAMRKNMSPEEKAEFDEQSGLKFE